MRRLEQCLTSEPYWRVLLFAVALLITGCTSVSPMRWAPTDPQRLARDEYECEREVRNDIASGGLVSLRSERDAWYQRCMEGRGHKRMK